MLGVSRDGDVVTIELQREERRNALNIELVTQLRDAVIDAAEQARVIVLTGRGPVFSAGADLGGVYSEEFLDRLLEMLHTIESAPVPVISAINGAALGAGVQLALASDLRVLEPDSYIAIPAAKLGITVDRWTVRRLVSLIGGGPARTILLGAESVSAEDAYGFGFANRIGTLADAQAWAKSIAELAPLSLRHLKLVLNDDGTRDPENAQQREALEAAWTSADAQEGRLARQEKRAAKFQGR
ncbi:enoyl-CoA hydratase [Nocardia cyriacigeorgica]|jgi:enoyl-CoA hydratase|uniref:Probable enoyl-CoA hydratase echA6 n=1 Tax=Nocardia cyriacigeorgica TaxID=135487 RepID=A0A2L2JYN4_9NOCA|nr:enoyl-CoA hydratase [Nocardia cyriacigeorgica]AVH24976.1 enoyl-CoA hydratase [Nocardia cyriacigeorgica]MBF6087237.1 enoyl-CoA hydratase [Nocardia cyriacigeorgica]MBF6092833.1 enoyl-CoA hydratase [Nocardia cyriacigeorgica]MBF6099404.1 enoyl-CoA hydratase [Nocardia cyriacigeorgica]MBF6159921.1 enoyl-CoA hydratase [Nocardia cyriacigeorgica]